MASSEELIITVTEAEYSAYAGRRATHIGVKPPITEGEKQSLEALDFIADPIVGRLCMAAIETAPDDEVSTFDMPLAPGPEHFEAAVDVAKIMMGVRGLDVANIEAKVVKDAQEG